MNTNNALINIFTRPSFCLGNQAKPANVIRAFLLSFLCHSAMAQVTSPSINTEQSSIFAPVAFSAEYQASYGGFKANAERQLNISDSGVITMSSAIKLRLLGRNISTIVEQSELSIDLDSNSYKPLDYSFTQSGIGKRQRKITFDWENNSALASNGKRENIIPLTLPIADNLSAYLEISKQLQLGRQEINIAVIEKGELKEFQYRVLGEEVITTALGAFNTVKLEKVRATNNNRSTEIWLAIDWDYLLIKLVQEEKSSRDIVLEIKQGSVNNTPVSGI